MATPIEDLRKGIEEGDWKAVVRVFNNLTGQKLKPPTNQKKGSTKVVKVAAEIPQPMIDALRFYANPDNWKTGGDPFAPTPAKVAADRGKMAMMAGGIAQETLRSFAEEDEPESPPVAEKKTHTPSSATEDFRVVHKGPANGETDEDGRRIARREPFRPGKNEFVDDLSIEAALAKQQKKYLDKNEITPTSRRPPVNDVMVKVECSRCNREYTIPASEANGRRRVEGDGEGMNHICLKCIRNGVSGKIRNGD